MLIKNESTMYIGNTYQITGNNNVLINFFKKNYMNEQNYLFLPNGYHYKLVKKFPHYFLSTFVILENVSKLLALQYFAVYVHP